jgi:hypothetical protein
VRFHSIVPQCSAGVMVKSPVCSPSPKAPIAMPIASIRSGGLRPSGAASAAESRIAVEPSMWLSQSWSRNGFEIIREAR